MRTQESKSRKRVYEDTRERKKKNVKNHSHKSFTQKEFEIYNEYEDVDTLDEFFSDPENREDYLD